jgi:hypothetical protein
MPDAARTLDEVTRVTPRADGGFDWTVPEAWSEGRSTWSGVVVAALVRAIESTEGDEARVLRNVTTELLSAITPGPAQIAVHVLRRGNRQSTLRADLVRGGEVLVNATGMLAHPRRQVLSKPSTLAPAIPPVDDVPVFVVPPPLPDTMRRFEFRPLPPPFSSAKEPALVGWLKLTEPPARSSAAMLAALIDAWWPGAWSTVAVPYMTVTTTAATALACDPRSVDLSRPMIFSGTTLFDHDGFQMEARALYDEAGKLLATNQRTFVVLS